LITAARTWVLGYFARHVVYVRLAGRSPMSCGGIRAGDHRHCGPCGRIRPVVTCPFCITGRACMACLDCPGCPDAAGLMGLLRAMTVASPLHYGATN
jgi:hypothetical protein